MTVDTGNTLLDISTKWHRVPHDAGIAPGLTKEQQDWLSTSLTGGFFVGFDDIYFENEADVTMFKLRFR